MVGLCVSMLKRTTKQAISAQPPELVQVQQYDTGKCFDCFRYKLRGKQPEPQTQENPFVLLSRQYRLGVSLDIERWESECIQVSVRLSLNSAVYDPGDERFLFRAEWEKLNTDRAQPHWQLFDESAGIGWTEGARFHFPMCAGWHEDDAHSKVFDEEKIPLWLGRCVRYISAQLDRD